MLLVASLKGFRSYLEGTTLVDMLDPKATNAKKALVMITILTSVNKHNYAFI